MFKAICSTSKHFMKSFNPFMHDVEKWSNIL